MISVCIPVFNVDVRKLTKSLISQAVNIPVEIILIDDKSQQEIRQLNRNLKDTGIQYHELEENIGRASIRNRFREYANHEHLLFLDCDSVIISDTFLSDYVETIREFPGSVVCGGRIYGTTPALRNRRLHWKYGTIKESRPAGLRKIDPNRSFMSSNFLLPLTVLREISFDERLSDYGHEDSLFGYELSKAGKMIIHIDNPVEHGELETNREFIEKTREAVQNLVKITRMPDVDPAFADTISLLRAARKFEDRGFAGILRLLSFLIVPLSGWILRLGCTCLNLLDAYKLGLYYTNKKK